MRNKGGGVLRHMMWPGAKMRGGISEGLRTSKIAGPVTRNKIKKYIDGGDKLKIVLLDSLVGCGHMYGTNIPQLRHSQISKIQYFYSGCIRSLLQGRFDEPDKNP